jgi:two-component system chemotaxis response regulator CheY
MALILAVDGSASMRKRVVLTLESANHSVIEASDGQQALDIANKQSLDLVLTDIDMPIMDGLDLTRKLRQLDDYRFKPILVLTAQSSIEMKKEGQAAGASGWIVKPFNPEQLLAITDRLLGVK